MYVVDGKKEQQPSKKLTSWRAPLKGFTVGMKCDSHHLGHKKKDMKGDS